MKAKDNEGKKLLSHRIHTRITKEKYEELSALLARSRDLHSHSELLRSILDHQQIRIKTYDASQEEIMEELCNIRRELQAIGKNINQVTHRFHVEDQPEGKLFQALEITQFFQQADLRISQLFTLIAKLSESWLPE